MPRSPEARERQRLVKAQWRKTPSGRASEAAARRRLMEDPEKRAKVYASNKAWRQSPEGKAWMQSYAKDYRERPENRARAQAYMAEYSKEYRAKPEVQAKGRVATRRWAAANREQIRKYRRAYYRTPQGKALDMAAKLRYRARYPGAQRIKSEYKDWGAVLRRDPCAYCGEPATDLDHIVPRTKGGSDEWDNFTPACMRCNRSKNNRSLLAFMARRLDRKVA